MSFLTLGIFRSGQQTQLNYLARADRHLSWLHLAVLATVALLLYWFNILLFGVTVYAAWRYALHARLLKDDVPSGASRVITRRILVAQALYAIGALLCVISTYVSIAFIVADQLNFAIAPRIPGLSRI